MDRSRNTYLCTSCLKASNNGLCHCQNTNPHIRTMNVGRRKMAELISQHQGDRKKILKLLQHPKIRNWTYFSQEVHNRVFIGGYDYAGDIVLTWGQFNKYKGLKFTFVEKGYDEEGLPSIKHEMYIVKDKKLYGVIFRHNESSINL